MYFLVILAVAAVAFYFYSFYSKQAKLPPGPTPLPLIGNFHQLDLEHLTESIMEPSKEYGPLFTLHLPEPTLVMTDYDLMMEEIVKNGDAYAGRAQQYLFNTLTSGLGVIATDGPLWHEQRRFSLHTLRDFGVGRNLMEEKVLFNCQTLLQDLQDASVKGLPVDIADSVQLVVGNVISDLLVGRSFNHEKDRFYQLKRMLTENFTLLVEPGVFILNMLPWLRHIPGVPGLGLSQMLANTEEMKTFWQKDVDRVRESIDYSSEPDNLVAAYLHEAKKRSESEDGHIGSFTNDQLLYLLIDLWMAGMETTSTTLDWAFIYMAKHREIQHKIQTEIQQVLGSREVDHMKNSCLINLLTKLERVIKCILWAERYPTISKVSMADRALMPYTAAALLETQRCSNIQPMNIIRRTTKPLTIKGYNIPIGTWVLPHISGMLWDEKEFPNPMQFDPERFLDRSDSANIKLTNTEKMIAFSLGKRQCLGESLARAELWLIFVSVVQRYTISAVDCLQLPDEKTVKAAATRLPTKHQLIITENA